MEKSLQRDIKRYGLEPTESGLLVPKANLFVGGEFIVEHFRKGECLSISHSKNKIPNAMLNHILNSVFAGSSAITTWYVGIYKNNYIPLATDTLSGGFLTSAGEAAAVTDYDEATRREYVEASSTAQSMTNSASKATFTINTATSYTVYGAFLCSAASGSTGTLAAAVLLSTAKAVTDLDVLYITYTIAAASS